MAQKRLKNSKTIGALGEGIAQNYLLKKGYELITTNYHIPGGEVDIIVKKNDILVFVEVKTRLQCYFGPGEEALNDHKKRVLLRTIFTYLTQHPSSMFSWQLDFIAIQIFTPKNIATVKHFSNILAT
jgi:putative endonuclease